MFKLIMNFYLHQPRGYYTTETEANAMECEIIISIFNSGYLNIMILIFTQTRQSSHTNIFLLHKCKMNRHSTKLSVAIHSFMGVQSGYSTKHLTHKT